MQTPAQQLLQLQSRTHPLHWPCIRSHASGKQHKELWAQSMHCPQLQIRSGRLLARPDNMCAAYPLSRCSGRGSHKVLHLFKQSGCVLAQRHSNGCERLSKHSFHSRNTVCARKSYVAAGAVSAIASEDPLQGDQIIPCLKCMYTAIRRLRAC